MCFYFCQYLSPLGQFYIKISMPGHEMSTIRTEQIEIMVTRNLMTAAFCCCCCLSQSLSKFKIEQKLGIINIQITNRLALVMLAL